MTLLDRLRRALGPLALLAAILATAVLWLAIDRVWWLLPLGYGPRWPWLVLVPIALLTGRGWIRRIIYTTVTAGVVLFGLVGVRVARPARAPTGSNCCAWWSSTPACARPQWRVPWPSHATPTPIS